MKILVTGGCGFIGSNFIHHMINNRECKIVNVDSLTYAGNIDNLSNLNQKSNYEFKRLDVCDKERIYSLLKSFRPNVLVHFAAESHVDNSISNPSSFIKTNVVGTTNLLTAAQKYFNEEKRKNFKFIHISTDEVYGSLGKSGLFREDSPYKPSSPYSASKASSDHFVRAWNKTYGLPTIITNCSNNYGPYQYPEKLIPLIITNCIERKPLPIYGDGSNVRDWLYVEDHCKAIDLVIRNGRIGETYNIGGNNEISNLQIVKLICKALDKKIPKADNSLYENGITFVEDRLGHDFRYAIDNTKIKSTLKWEPNINFKDGIDMTVSWYVENENWWRKIKKEDNSN